MAIHPDNRCRRCAEFEALLGAQRVTQTAIGQRRIAAYGGSRFRVQVACSLIVEQRSLRIVSCQHQVATVQHSGPAVGRQGQRLPEVFRRSIRFA